MAMTSLHQQRKQQRRLLLFPPSAAKQLFLLPPFLVVGVVVVIVEVYITSLGRDMHSDKRLLVSKYNYTARARE